METQCDAELGTKLGDDNKKLPRADHISERVRRLDKKLDRVLYIIAIQNQKIDGLLDLATGTRADLAGFMKLYSAQEDAVSRIARDVELIKKRLDLVDA